MILKMLRAFKQDKDNRLYNKSLGDNPYTSDLKPTYSFYVAYKGNGLHASFLDKFIELDEEDILYFKNKYSKKANDELKFKIEELNNEYTNSING